jgi:hypothetical protein
MEDNDTSTSVEVEQEAVSFTPEQQKRLQEILNDRLAQQARVKDAEIENIRNEAKKQLQLSRGNLDRVDTYLHQQHQKNQQEEITRTELRKYFGPSGNANEAARLYRESRPLYDQMRKRARELGLVS